MPKKGNLSTELENGKEDLDVELVKKTVLIAQIKRRERIQAASDYIGFGVSRICGLGSLVIAVLIILGLEIPRLKVQNPQYFLALGLSLLVGGRRIVSILTKIANTYK